MQIAKQKFKATTNNRKLTTMKNNHNNKCKIERKVWTKNVAKLQGCTAAMKFIYLLLKNNQTKAKIK